MRTQNLQYTPGKVTAVRGAGSYEKSEEVQGLVRQALDGLSLDQGWIRSGDRVVMKPNWVKESDERFQDDKHWEYVVTHPAVIEAVCHWVAPRLEGNGSIVICDAPQTDSSFRKIREYCQLDKMVERLRGLYPNITIDLLDLRPEEWHAVDGVTVSKTKLPGDPLGSTHVRLNEFSEFVDFAGQGKLYGASYDMEETNSVHRGERHEYMLCRTPMDADVLINLPKLKTHKKVGLTCALKNLVGINANKNWLPHHTEGSPEDGGDQFPKATTKAKLENRWMGTAKRWLKNRPGLSLLFVPLKKLGRLYFGDTQKVVRSGNWSGNDTCWRMVLDLNKCLLFFNGAGERREKPLRYLAVVDGIIGGDGNGPMAPDPKPSGVIIAGTHPTSVDAVSATVMGFDWQRIRMLRNAFDMKRLSFTPFSPDDIEVVSNYEPWQGTLNGMTELLDYKPHFGWVGAIEKQDQAVVE